MLIVGGKLYPCFVVTPLSVQLPYLMVTPLLRYIYYSKYYKQCQ